MALSLVDPRRLESFNEYKVSIKMTSIAPGRTANLIIYDINGQSLEGETLTNSIGPKVYLEEQLNGLVGEKYLLNKPHSFDLLDGLIDFSGSVKVYDPDFNQFPVYQDNGNPIEDDIYLPGSYFLPDKAGKYEIVYVGKDLENLEGNEHLTSVTIILKEKMFLA